MNGKAHLASRPPTTVSELETLKSEIEALESLELDLLRRRWRGLLGRPAPAHLSRSLLVRILAYRHQVARLGDIDRASRVALGEMIGDPKFRAGGAAGAAPSAKASVALRPGTVLEREHGGIIHRVTVTVGGCSWNGREFRSLSEVALAVTGTKWNGPRFFGLRSEKKIEKARGDDLLSTTAAAEVGP
jgi:hypothetical protein